MKNKHPFLLFAAALVLGFASFPALAASGGNDIGNLPQILMENLGIIANVIQSLAILMGLGLFIGGMFQLKRYGEQRTMMSSQMSIGGPLMMLLSGVSMLFLPTFISTVLVAFWGVGGDTDLPVQSSDSGWAQYIQPVLMLVRIIGIYAFMKGFVLAAKTGNHQGGQQGGVGKVLVHIFAGILCVHIMGTIELLESILGFDFSI